MGRGLEVLVQWVVRIWSAVIGEGLDAIARVQAEDFGDQIADRVFA